MKLCVNCHKELPLKNFCKGYKLTKHSYCRKCQSILYKNWRLKNKSWKRKYGIEWRKRNPWAATRANIYSRLITNKNNPKNKCYVGIKNKLTTQDLKFLWFRDKAYLMKTPSIDRVDSKKDYILENCRYVELQYNCSRSHHGLE